MNNLNIIPTANPTFYPTNEYLMCRVKRRVNLIICIVYQDCTCLIYYIYGIPPFTDIFYS
jgi:hypothetical protein